MNSPAIKTTTIPRNSLPAQLQQIGLRAVPTQLDDFLARATKAHWSPHQILEQLVQAEIAERSRRSLERRLRLSRAPEMDRWRQLASGRMFPVDAQGAGSSRRGRRRGPGAAGLG